MTPDIACNDGGIIYVQGEQKRPVTESEMLDALYEEALAFAARVERGEAGLSTTGVAIAPPDPLPCKHGSVPSPTFHQATRR